MPEELIDTEMENIERELAELLAVEPSPEFAAQVRTRIEQQSGRAFAWWRWALLSCAAAAVILAAVVTVTRRTPASRPPVAPLHADVSLPHPEHVAERRTAEAGRARVVRRTRPLRTAQPEILIDPSLAQAVRRLVVEQRVLPEVPPETTLEPVVVEPLKVPEIASTGGAGL
jgi:hypothetical protein